ncbi:MAG: hypothetical protein RIB46_16680 [Pseudomonadales bacterium]
MGFFSFIVLLAIAYLVWRVTDQLPDLIFRMSEIQRDVAELRRRLAEVESTGSGATPGPTASGDDAQGS